MQRCCRCGVDLSVDGKGDVAEVEGLGASFGRGRVEVLSGSQEPEEGDNDEVDGVGIEHAIDWVVEVQGIHEGLQDGDVGWVGAGGRFIFVSEGFEESSEYGMELVGQWALLAGIAAGQVGDPLAHGQERFFNRVSADRVVGLAVASVAQGEDEEVSELCFLVRDITEGRLPSKFLAELGPVGEVGILGPSGLGRGSCGGLVQRSAEISFEATSSGSCNSFQGRDCG